MGLPPVRNWLLHVAWGTLFAWGLFHTARWSIARLFSKHTHKQHELAALALVCLVHNVFSAGTSMAVTPYRSLLLGGEARWLEPVEGFEWPACACISVFLLDSYLNRLWSPWTWLLVVHHLISIWALASACWVRVGHGWLLYMISTEFSSIFLSCRNLISILGDKESRAYAVVTVLFGLSFIGIRTLPIPFLLRTWLLNAPFGVAACGPTYSAQAMGIVALAHPAMNAYWTVAILKMAFRKKGRKGAPSAGTQGGTSLAERPAIAPTSTGKQD